MIKYLVFITILFYVVPHKAIAQPVWQWLRAGGTVGSAGKDATPDVVKDITADKWGNLYVLTEISGNNQYLNKLKLQKAPVNADRTICIACFNCGGLLQWYKMISGSAEARAVAIKTDTLGGVYIFGNLSCSVAEQPNKIGKGYVYSASGIDTAFLPLCSKTMFLLKTDTGGYFQWLRFPTPGTATNSVARDMYVTENGTATLLAEITDYGHTVSATVSKAGVSVLLHVDVDGNLTKTERPKLFSNNTEAAHLHLTHDEKRKRSYFGGFFPETNGTSVSGTIGKLPSCFLICINDSGRTLWSATGTEEGAFAKLSGRPAIDRSGNIYVTGTSKKGFNFNGNYITGGSAFLIKIDTNGNNVWVSYSKNIGSVEGYGVAVVKDTVAVVGIIHSQSMVWGKETFFDTSSARHTFICRLHTDDGNVTDLHFLKTNNSNCLPGDGTKNMNGANSAIAVDKLGNIYVGGFFTSELYAPHDTVFNQSDVANLWIAKLGYMGKCFVSDNDRKSLFNYLASKINIYIEPASNNIIIENAVIGYRFKLLNIEGRQIFSGIINSKKHSVNMTRYPNGVYSLQLNDENGNSMSRNIVKQ
jgi:hypothetical protein